MTTLKQTWTFVDRSSWPAGPWDGEPIDKAVWVDEETKLDCMIHRNGAGGWCGYVGVKKGHPLHGVGYSDVPEDTRFNVHGGLTFAAGCHGMDDDGRGICHPADGDDHVWWLGFDCNHTSDLSPLSLPYMDRGTYRVQAWVINQTSRLAAAVLVVQLEQVLAQTKENKELRE